MIKKNLRFDIKSVGDSGTFDGYAAVFSNRDLGGDVILKGAFAKTIAERPQHWLLWNHNADEVIGISTSEEKDFGLAMHGELNMETPKAVTVHSLIKQGLAKGLPMGLSIGFDVLPGGAERKNGTRYLSDLKLWENSLTAFPMNPEALVTEAKSAEDYECLLEQLIESKDMSALSADKAELIERAIKRLSALRAALDAPGAAKHEDVAPEQLHAMFDRFDFLKK